ncbi:hypothetical protein ACLOJK_033827 [Asimina triloba]
MAAPTPPPPSCLLSSTISAYFQSLSQTPQRLRKRMLATWTPNEELNQVRLRSGSDMKRKLEWYDLVALGVSGMLGVGVFITTGAVARNNSGSAVFISYIIAGVSAFLSSLCYTEFSIEIPVAGGAFSYLRITFGEFAGYFGGANILLEYVLSNAAAARTFTDYFCSAFGVQEPNSWRIDVGGYMLDFPAVVLILLLTLSLCHSTKESSTLNLVMTVFHVFFFGFIVIAGFCIGSTSNLIRPNGFAPFGARGVLDGAAIVYLSYIGYDSVSTMAEEIKNPSKSLPVGIAGSVLIVSVIYCLMALSLSLMLPYNEIPENSAYAFAFGRLAGWRWAGNIVAAGASLGIMASLVVAMLGQARYLCVIGRSGLVPLWLAKVQPSTGTPMNATIFLGICTASIALLTDLQTMFDMISIGTLFVFYMVANALVYRRHAKHGGNRPLPTLIFLLLLTSTSIGFSLSWKFKQPWWVLAILGASLIAITAIFDRCFPCSWRPAEWSVPLMPWPGAASIFLNVFLMTTLKKKAFQRFGVWSCVVTLFYILYGVHSTYLAADEIEEDGNNQIPTTQQQTIKIEIQGLR